MKYRPHVAIGSALALLPLACAPAGEGDGGDPGDPYGKISTNGLSFESAAIEELDAAPLGAEQQSQDESQTEIRAATEHSELLELGEPGEDLLEYVAYCALDESQTLVAEDPESGDARTFSGLAGLAPEWADESCGDACQRWVSACLLAHANGQGEPFPIALRGGHPALDWPNELEEEFEVEEAAYYGNLFEADPEKYACIGRGLFDGSWADQASYLKGRICGLTGSDCGLETTGTCHSITGDGIADSSTCQEGGGDGSPYGACHTEARDWDSEAYDEVITVYLEP